MIVFAATAALLLLALGGGGWAWFVNPGALSGAHARPGFGAPPGGVHGEGRNCLACHVAAGAGLSGWLGAAAETRASSLPWGSLISPSPADFGALDRACERCHARHAEHEPSVERHPSCSVCHREHRGRATLVRPEEAHCLDCHGSASVMQAASLRGAALPAGAWSRTTGLAARPPQGFTGLITSFEAGHPEFRVLAGAGRATNALRFSHRLHLGETVKRADGRPPGCADCHRPDATGRFLKAVRFEEHCRSCHALQFDAGVPELEVPHGAPGGVRTFLAGLRTQYAEAATRGRGFVDPASVRTFVREAETRLLAEFRDLSSLEERIFFGRRRDPAGSRRRADFDGCVLCHEMRRNGGDVPVVTPPDQPERWMFLSTFDHARHAGVDCLSCHVRAGTSEAAIDLLLPGRAACVTCHGSAGGAPASCTACHTYHHLDRPVSGTVEGPRAGR